MTLPTRPDGGIDWDKVSFPVNAEVLVEENKLWLPSRLFKEIAAHERERCARLAEAPDGPDPEGNIAAAIRGMED